MTQAETSPFPFGDIPPVPFGDIPSELRALRHWVMFRVEDGKAGKPTKVPYQTGGGKASSTNPAHWTSFSEAVAASARFSGIGFMFQGSGFAGIDLDHCAADGVLEDWAQTVADSFASYTEFSWSGTGVHIIVKGQVEKGRKHGDFECYSRGRYFTMSGRPVPGTPAGIAERQEELDAFVARVFPPDAPRQAGPRTASTPSRLPLTGALSDADLIAKALAAKNGAEFGRLWNSGDTSGHQNDESRADLALCTHLAFWLGNDAGAIDRLFRQSALCRPKWEERPDYRERTLARAIACTSQCYEPKPRNPKPLDPKSYKNGNSKNGSRASSPEEPAPEGEPEGAEEWAGDTPSPKTADGLPVIETNGRHLRDESADALAALVAGNDPPSVFVRGGQLTRVQIDENNRSAIVTMTAPMLRGCLDRRANFVSTSEKRGCISVVPPQSVVDDLLALPEWPDVPPLTGLVTAPIFARNGDLETQLGYHAAVRLYYHEAEALIIPDTAPTPESIRWAKSLILDELLGDFPFADAASRAHAVALLLLPFVRPMINGVTPIHLIDAPASGTGKSLLAKVCTLPFVPEGATVKTPPTEEAEWSKTLISIFSDGNSHLLLDNVRYLNSPSFFAAVTSTLYKDRLLGTNRTVAFENRLVWLVTCNNIQGNDELSRRSIWIRLDAGVEQPEERDGFGHPDLIGWAKANRGALIGAALILIRVWVEAGMPPYAGQEKPVGSFETWARVLGGILGACGIEGFLTNRQEQRSRVDTETTAWHGFVDAWHTRHREGAVLVTDLFPLALEWMPEKMGDGSERSQKSKFGRLLVKHVDKVFGGHKIAADGRATSGPNKNMALFRLEPVRTPKIGRHGTLGRHEPLPHVVVSEEENLKREEPEDIQPGHAPEHVSQVSHVSRFDNAEDEEETIL